MSIELQTTTLKLDLGKENRTEKTIYKHDIFVLCSNYTTILSNRYM